MTATDYNGWTNYETWNVALHIDNEQGSQEYWRERAKANIDLAEATEHITKQEDAYIKLCDDLKAEFEANAPELEGTYGDLLNAALSEVNWYEIAKNIIDNLED